MTAVPPLVEEMIRAQGGPVEGSPVFDIRLSSGGFAFASKFQRRALHGLDARVSPTAQEVHLSPFPREGHRAVFHRGVVRIEDDEGRVIAERRDARPRFSDVRHLLWWDALDIAYFAGYALWTYLSLPFVLTQPGLEIRELGPVADAGTRLRRLAVRFPPDVHTHCPEQVLCVDDAGLILRHNYVAEPFGKWAKAAHYCLDYRWFGEVRAATRRRVYPARGDGRRVPGPLLVWIDVHDLAVQP